jgi:hypothetical protein
MKIVTFATIDTMYEAAAENLKKSCIEFGHDCTIVKVPDKGKWLENIQYKAGVILDFANTLEEGEVFMYLDADAVIRKPGLENVLNQSCQFGAHIRVGGELLSGTLFIRNCAKSREILTLWKAECASNPGVWDQITLHNVIKANSERIGLSMQNTGYEFTRIFDRGNVEPVVEHMQMSRKTKRLEARRQISQEQVKQDRKVLDFPGYRYPDMPHGNISRVADGTYRCRRHVDSDIAYLNAFAVKRPRELVWEPVQAPHVNHNVIFDLVQNECYIVGKGPSLDKVTAETFTTNSPVICVNDSIHKIESLDIPNHIMLIQHDHSLRDTCIPTKGGYALIFEQLVHWFAAYPKNLVYTHQMYGMIGSFTALSAIQIMRHYGVDTFKFIGFDAVTDRNYDYAESVGPNTKNKERFADHRAKMIAATANVKATFLVYKEDGPTWITLTSK